MTGYAGDRRRGGGGVSRASASSRASAREEKRRRVTRTAHETLGLVAEGAQRAWCSGVGLTVISGMRRAAKVSGFLSATATSWDPSADARDGRRDGGSRFPGFAVAARARRSRAARAEVLRAAEEQRHRQEPPLTGGVMFGAGWGLAGMCPGPAIVSRSAARPDRGRWARGSAPSPSGCGRQHRVCQATRGEGGKVAQVFINRECDAIDRRSFVYSNRLLASLS